MSTKQLSKAAYADRLHCYFFTIPTYDRFGQPSQEEVQVDIVENLREAIKEAKSKLLRRALDIRSGQAFVAWGNEEAYRDHGSKAKWGKARKLPKNWSI